MYNKLVVEILAALFVFIIALFFLLPYLGRAAQYGAPFVPMEREVVTRVLELAHVGPDTVFYDLGSGDGRLIIAAAMRGAKKAVGIEIDAIRVMYSRFWLKILRLANARIVKGDLFKEDISDATVVSLYLLPETNEKLIPKLQKELKKGTLVVATGFQVAGWKPVRVDPRGTVYGPIYLYKI